MKNGLSAYKNSGSKTIPARHVIWSASKFLWHYFTTVSNHKIRGIHGMSLQWKVLFVSSQKGLKYTSKGFTLTNEKGSSDKGIFLGLPHMYFLMIYLVIRMHSLEGQICVLLKFRLFSLSVWNQEILVRCGLIICLDQRWGWENICYRRGRKSSGLLTPRNSNSVWTAGVNLSEPGDAQPDGFLHINQNGFFSALTLEKPLGTSW